MTPHDWHDWLNLQHAIQLRGVATARQASLHAIRSQAPCRSTMARLLSAGRGSSALHKVSWQPIPTLSWHSIASNRGAIEFCTTGRLAEPIAAQAVRAIKSTSADTRTGSSGRTGWLQTQGATTTRRTGIDKWTGV